MDSTFEHLIKLHMESKEFSDVILEGNRFIIAHQDGRTRFKAWGNDKKKVFTTFRSIVEMADIVCGVLDAHGRKYWMSKSVKGDYCVKVLS